MIGRDSHWAAFAAVHLCQMHLVVLKEAIDKPETATVSWSNPVIECQYPIDWDWENAVPKGLSAAVSNPAPLEYGIDLLDILTHGTGWKIARGTAIPMVTTEQKEELQRLPDAARHRHLDHILEPFVLVVGADVTGSDPDRENLFVLPRAGAPETMDMTIGLRFEVHQLVADYDAQRAYYPVITSLTYSQPAERITASVRDRGTEIFAQLNGALESATAAIMAVTLREASGSVLDLPQPITGPRQTFPERRRTIMSPVPMPRAAAKEAASLALVRGLGRMFAGYSNVPDLDINGAIATAAAEKALWGTLEEVFRAKGIDYHRTEEHGTVEYILRGINEVDARGIWDIASRSLNKGQGGPGIEVQPPNVEGLSRFQAGRMVTESRLVFWPTVDITIRTTLPVRFRSESAPGYIALLETYGTRPYFADGWLWIRRGTEREGFRIGGLSTLLFPEGRAALEHMAATQLADRESELNRIFRNPTLFRDEDQKAVQDLRAGIERLRKWLAGLTVYDSSHDLILCIFEAFYRQRDQWARHEVALRSGQTVGTAPWRVIRLDPKELRLRLDPGEKWGGNWRARLLEKLEALATFERQTRGRNGRKVDVGDRLVLRIIDGLRRQDARGSVENDPGIGLVRLLGRAGALPEDAFYVEVSVDFMGRLVTWAVDQNGALKWGLDAARTAEQEDGRGESRGAVEQARKQAYFQHSPRLLAFSNLEGWAVNRKLLASILLQEATPARHRPRGRQERRGDRLLTTFNGRQFVNCNGANGLGYRVAVWMQKAGYNAEDGARASFGGFVDDLGALVEALGLYLEIGDRGGTKPCASGVDALQRLEQLKASPEDALSMKMRAYLPADLEGHLRERLANKARIEACDASDGTEGPVAGMSGQELKAARLMAGLDQASLARAIGVSKMSVSQWENRQKPIPAARAARIREVLEGRRGESSKPQVTKNYAQ